MKIFIPKNSKGFTLVEVIVYVAIFSIFVAGLASFTGSMTSSRVNSQTFFEVNDQGTRAINVITQTLRNAAAVASPAIGTVSDSLSVATATPASSPTVFSLNGGILYVTEGVGSPAALTNGKITISDLVFYNLSRAGKPCAVQIRFKANNTNFYGSATLRQ
jgi:prepilin-type N-terminal cleavage/methylation domain-containing protein